MNKEINMDMEKDMDKKNNFAESNVYKNCLALVRLCENNQNMLEEIKKYLSDNNHCGIADHLSNRSSIKLIILMDDEGIILIKDYDALASKIGEINPDLKKELSRIFKYFFSCYSVKAYPCRRLL